ncbi:tetratricopeptide repeat protein 1 isoform X2 [Sitodiplosis mosellana]|uniref:tetratricopeptide repeat protein 1 isoform X2 n=1 Tax=Sitodiplosis mosellana TaxID=263140 RepID=UPI002444D7AD|nr:tetratricopeptide repeat protein 1 isoform X2 [Sitodiplosis mosellana]
MASPQNELDVKQPLDDTSDNEFHDAEDNDKEALEEKFSDALDLNEPIESEKEPEEEPEPELSEEELQANKEKAESLKQEGNSAFKNAEYEKSIDLYTEALAICPKKCTVERAILFNNRAAAHKHLGAQSVAIEDCTKAIENNPNYIKAYARRATLYEETDKLDECMADYNKILELDPSSVEAKTHVTRLQPIVHERNERLKEEMMGKLKDLGNMILKPFGLSTNNFQLQQDPNTGSYSVNFQQNPPRS